jgi:hypothetical protein
MADIDFNTWKRNQLKALLQREQDRAFALLDSNPLLSSLLLNYQTEPAPVDNEELIALRASHNSLRKDYDRLQADLQSVEWQKRELVAACSELKVQLAEIKSTAGRVVEENGRLHRANDALRGGVVALRLALNGMELRVSPAPLTSQSS